SSEVPLELREGERTQNRPTTDRAQQDPIELRSAPDLLSRHQRQQCPVGARGNEKSCRAQQRGAQVQVIGGVPQAGPDRADDLLGWKTLTVSGWRLPPNECTDNSKMPDSIQPERRRNSREADNDARQGRADRAADIDSHAVEGDSVRKVFARHELWHDGLPRR